MQITQYYDRNKDWKSELKKLNRSIVAAFLDLLEILIKCVDSATNDVFLDPPLGAPIIRTA